MARSAKKEITCGVVGGCVVVWLLAALLLPSSAFADCLDDAATYWGVPVPLARAIAMQESGMRPNAINKNTNGSRDIGLMQINSWWLPTLKKFGVSETDLLDGCKNSYVGNWILAQNIARHGLTWTAVGAYNATTPEKQDAYARKIFRQYLRYQASLLSTATAPLAGQ